MGTKILTVHVPEKIDEALERLVEARYFHTKAEAIRAAIMDLVDRMLPLIEEVDRE